MPTIATPPPAQLRRWIRDDRPRRHLEAWRPILTRLRAAARHTALTQELAAGADPSASAELAICARRLISRRMRTALAGTLERVVRDARRPPFELAPIPVQRGEVMEAEAPLRAMIARLRDPRPAAPEGMALIHRIVTDGTWSPLFGGSVPGALRRLSVLATAALEPEASVPAAARGWAPAQTGSDAAASSSSRSSGASSAGASAAP